jgi:hypothetical protein
MIILKNGSKTGKDGLHLYTKYHDAVMLRKKLPLTIYVENLTKSENRKWMSNRPEIEPQGMGPRVNVLCQISRGCDK